ncbi:1-acylglycerol-3-phosphate O-acyltransferase ABHD5-like isoform X1 [Amphibalanus amphitrite]|uniref:1-acylglycerol-3-phosphate O-acyltransferase ABHD5-like isoform X1 n=2 Tax=Amphibalanus amphitrite TaxID=1232801 RepID=UPI001C91349C|nr:1-acylglycerol-3-phosphate O-acyltransferase ABHD5-like isoform X1 [Amphibalanus amphitrite]
MCFAWLCAKWARNRRRGIKNSHYIKLATRIRSRLPPMLDRLIFYFNRLFVSRPIMGAAVPAEQPLTEEEILALAEQKMEEEHGCWLPDAIRWNPTSFKHVRDAEKNILKFVPRPHRSFYVEIGPVVGRKPNRLWTVAFNEESKEVPLVLLHGFASGVGLWCLNYDALAANRPVYAFDNLGFGRSSRPEFSKDAMEVESQYVEAIEKWRQEMNIDRMILLGHSMGGFLSCAYALKYPERLEHLVLADPWGFSEPVSNEAYRLRIPLIVRGVLSVVKLMNPLSVLRLGGRWGSTMIAKARPDLMKKFSGMVHSPPGTNYMANYIYHCNAQTPSGEVAFHTLSSDFGWAKNPMIRRVGQVDPQVPMTAIYGSRSWIDDCGQKIRGERPGSYVDVETILGASHHVYADQPETFNELVSAACLFSRGRLEAESTRAGFFLRDEDDEDEEGQAAALADRPGPSTAPAPAPAAAAAAGSS